jgi:hypothetical protein
MDSLWTPPEQADAEREALIDRAASSAPVAIALTKVLRRELDPYLEVVFVGEGVERLPAESRPPGMVPARWHVRRSHPDYMDMYRPIMGPQGEYEDLNESKLVNDMKAADLWRAGALEDMQKRETADIKAQQRSDALLKEQRVDMGIAAYKAAKRVAGDGGMSRRTWGKGRVKGVVGH